MDDLDFMKSIASLNIENEVCTGSIVKLFEFLLYPNLSHFLECRREINSQERKEQKME